MVFDIATQALKCGRCDRTMSIEEADEKEARHAGSSFSMDLLTCPTCGAEIKALNTAQATFCSYCGASVLLEKQEGDMEPPERIAPFQITREQCFEAYQKTLAKSLCADHRLKKSVTAESFRGIYIPQYEYSAAIAGHATLEGHYTKGDDTYYYNTTVNLDHQYDHIRHDASSEMPDNMSEKIAHVAQDAFRPFSPAYISGYYADIPDTDREEYLPFARAEAVRNGLKDVIDDLDDGCTYSTQEAEKKLIPIARAKYTGTTLAPAWFMAIRSGKRVLYAIANGVTGEMVADVPLDIPRFGIFALILAVPLFFLLNTFLTLRPEMVMVIAMGLAIVARGIINHLRGQIAEKENGPAESEDTKEAIQTQLKKRKRLARNSRGSGLAGLIAEGSGLGGVVVTVVGAYFLSTINDVRVFHIAAVVLTLIMGGTMLYGYSTEVSGKQHSAGSIITLLAMIAGCVILVFNVFHSADLPVYLAAFVCLAGVLWESVEMMLLHNRECSNPLPQFESHQGGERP